MLWRSVVIDLAGFDSLPSRSWWWFYHWRHSNSKQRSCFSKIDKIEQNPLIDMDIFNGKVEPESCTGIARVGTNKQIIFILIDEINASQIPYQTIVKIIVWYTNKVLWYIPRYQLNHERQLIFFTCFKWWIKTQVTFLCLSRVSWWSHNNPLDISKTSFCIGIIRVYIMKDLSNVRN